MPAEAIAQGGVEQVRRRMVGADGIAARGIDREMDLIAHLDRARFDLRLMGMQPPQRLGGVGDC